MSLGVSIKLVRTNQQVAFELHILFKYTQKFKLLSKFSKIKKGFCRKFVQRLICI